jgi:hypothetical protein
MRCDALSSIAGLVGILGFAWLTSCAEAADGFDLSKHSVPLNQIVSGGPSKDGIPAILKPVFVSAKEGTFLRAEDRVLGLSQGGEAKAVGSILHVAGCVSIDDDEALQQDAKRHSITLASAPRGQIVMGLAKRTRYDTRRARASRLRITIVRPSMWIRPSSRNWPRVVLTVSRLHPIRFAIS